MWNLKSDDKMIKVLEEYAIIPNSETRILIYDNIQISCGSVASRFDASARIYSVLRHFGIKHVSIIMDNALDEHFEDEYAANHPKTVRMMRRVVTKTQKAFSATDQPSAPKTSHAEYDPDLMTRSASTFQMRTQIRTKQHRTLTKALCTTATGEISLSHPTPLQWPEDMLGQALLGRGQFVSYDTMVKLVAGDLGPYRLLDARSAEEHAGHVTGYEYVTAAGRIPTSESVVNAEYQLSVDDNLADILGYLEKTLQGKDILKNDRIIWYCGTGWRAARMCVLTQFLGYRNVAIYEGGWNEWYQLTPH